MIVTIDGVLDQKELAWLRQQLATIPWRNGTESAGGLARDVKRNRQADENSDAARRLGDFVLDKVARHPQFVSAALPHTIYPPQFNRYGPGETYGTHIDSAIMRHPLTHAVLRSDVSATLFLSAPEEYEGGVLEVDTAIGVQEVKLMAGSLVLYPASSLHRITPVHAGERLAAFFWIQSMIRNDSARAALFDFDQAIQVLQTMPVPDVHVILKLSGVYHNLLRIHADC
jgi:PKHD-type hydroxylase